MEHSAAELNQALRESGIDPTVVEHDGREWQTTPERFGGAIQAASSVPLHVRAPT